MTAELVAATANPGKLREFRAILAEFDVHLVSPAGAGTTIDVEETGTSFEENARIKAVAYAAAARLPALADDSGIEVDALGGFPGIESARWVPGSDEARLQALLKMMEDVPQSERSARFRAVAALARPDGHIEIAEGRLEGRIAFYPRGAGGFGYDPIFLVEDGGYDGDVTSAELSAAEKNRLSHRGRAIRALFPKLRDLIAEVDRA